MLIECYTYGRMNIFSTNEEEARILRESTPALRAIDQNLESIPATLCGQPDGHLNHFIKIFNVTQNILDALQDEGIHEAPETMEDFYATAREEEQERERNLEQERELYQELFRRDNDQNDHNDEEDHNEGNRPIY